MAYEPLHHKYRPQTFADLVGQEAIATTLTNAILQSRIAPAYLFTGPRGTGKTSSARILAKSLNCQSGDHPTPTPCGTCEACRSIVSGSALDVIEIDAASNTGVDNIRELIEKAQFAPVQCRFKVYVVDECHMLSTAAFNALLKTLEEPPDRVVFVLATTDPQRVLPTIISRCQRFDYRRIPLESMVSHLRFIADQENIEIEQDALTLVAQIAQGGLRDAESLLDQLSLLPPPIQVEAVWDLVGAVPERDLLALAEAIAKNHPEGMIDRARHLMNRGREPLIVLQNLASFYRDLLIAKTAPQRHDLVAITPSTWEAITTFVKSIPLATLLQGQEHLRASEVQLKNTTQPRLWLEVTLLGLLPGAQIAAPAMPAAPVPAIAAPPAPTASQAIAAPPAPTPTPIAPTPTPAPAPMPPAPEPPGMVQQASAALGGSPASGNAPPENATEHVNLKELWKRIVANVEFRSTQMLLRQQGRLLKVTDKAARVGINERWISNLQGKLPAIEAAFAKTMGHPLKVSLESVVPQSEEEDVPAPPIPLTPAASAPPPNPSPTAPPAAAPPSPAPPSTPSPTAPPIATTAQTASLPQQATTTPAQPSPSVPRPTSAPPPIPEPLPTTPAPPQVPPPTIESTQSSSAQLSPIGSLPSPSATPSSREPQAEPVPVSQLMPATPAPGMQAPGLADWDEGELLRAAKSLAQFFNGEVVPMDGSVDSALEAATPETDSVQHPEEASPAVATTIPVPAAAATAALPNALPEDEEEDDDDVPF